MKELIPYRGAWLYEISDGYEGNYRGFHYCADTIEELKQKIDQAIDDNDSEKTLQLYSSNPKYYKVMNEDDDIEEGINWVVQYQLLSMDEYDDDIGSDSSIKEIVITAPDFDTAVKYARQYVHVQAHEDETWKNAEIISLEQQ